METNPLTFGVKTTPMRTTFEDIARVWAEADALEEIEHAWLWDHFLPLFSPPTDPVLEGWTTLAALAARTERLRLGLLVTANPARPPAVLGKMAATVDVISGGRLVFGIGVGGTRQPDAVANPAVAEYAAYGLPLVAPSEGIGRLDEALRLIRRMWTSDEPFDFDGRHFPTQGTVCVPRPVQRPGRSGPPILVGGWGDRTLRVVAEHADIWNVPGPPHGSVDEIRRRSAVLDRQCAAIGRDPATIVRSTQLIVAYDDPAASRAVLAELVGAGVSHLVLALPTPYPPGAARWLVDELILPTREAVGATA
jgi:alkanesulfonate monooxygenase SsuD/methylene tetrahydromethanopterin reductase-like flavin-dependent oxidoreductase (luciferase family)